MKISIITVVFNGASTIEDCIVSVLSQTYNDIEYIVIDGSSTDGTGTIIARFADKIYKVVSEPDAGIYDAMNKGVALATGEYIAFLNADDFYYRANSIEKMVEVLKNQDFGAAYADLLYVDRKNKHKITRYWQAGTYKENNFLFGWMPPHPTFVAKRIYYKQFGGFILDLGSAADYELMLRFVHIHKIKIGYMNQPMVVMRAGGVSNQTFENRLKANNNDQKAWVINDIKPYFFSLWLKPIRKIMQFLYKPTYLKIQ